MRQGIQVLSISLIAVVGLLGGCVQQDRYDSLMQSNRSLQEQLVSTQDERDVAEANLNALREQLNASRSEINRLEKQNAMLSGDLDDLGQSYDSLMGRVTELQVGPLPGEVESALSQLSSSYPDVLSFDSKTGMLRFASDFTFDLGSTDLKPEAKQTVQRLAQILSTSAAAPFEIKIVGHTDNMPIAKPSTKAKHPTNVHLSVHRAISVQDSLVNAGVRPQRIQVAGYGPHRPVVPNGPRGAAENRRVEIFLVPVEDSDFTSNTTAGRRVPDNTRTNDRSSNRDTAEARPDVEPMK